MGRTVSEIGELSLVDNIRRRFSREGRGGGGVLTGIGDDAAVLKAPKGKLLATTDMMVEGIHFDLGFVTPYQLGFKLVSVNVSDIYAMGGTPHYMLIDIAAAGKMDALEFERFFDGVEKAMRLYKVSLVGGDISSSEKALVVSATLLGHAEKTIKRKGARPGDLIYVTGPLGESAAGLALLKIIGRRVEIDNSKRLDKPLGWDVMRPLLKRHLMPVPRKPVSPLLRYATSMIDISDGLFIDLWRIMDESNVGARVYKERIPLSNALLRACGFLKIDPLELAVSGGEDYELLFTAPKGRNINAVCIGEITERGAVFVDERGRERKFSAEGYRHFQ